MVSKCNDSENPDFNFFLLPFGREANTLILLYNLSDPKTSIYYSGISTNPDLAMVSVSIHDKCKKEISNSDSGHHMTKFIIQRDDDHGRVS